VRVEGRGVGRLVISAQDGKRMGRRGSVSLRPEAEFLDVIGTKVLNVFLLAIYSHLY
jgi:hypothetical protein